MARPRIETPELTALTDLNHVDRGELRFPPGFVLTPFDVLVATVSKSYPALTDQEQAAQIAFIGAIPEGFTDGELQYYRAFLRGMESSPLFRNIYNVRSICSQEQFLFGLSYKTDLQFVVARLLQLGYGLGEIRQVLGEENRKFAGVNSVVDLIIMDLHEQSYSDLIDLADKYKIIITADPKSLEPLMRTHKFSVELSYELAQLWLKNIFNEDQAQQNNFQYVNSALRAYGRFDEKIDDPRKRANIALSQFDPELGANVVNIFMGWSIGGHQIPEMVDRGYEELKTHSSSNEVVKN